MDRLKTMQTFVTVVSEGSFSGAAEKLGMSRALVTKHVMDLEKRLGARLINRSTRKISPTEIGKRYCAFAKNLIHELDQADSSIARSEAGRLGPIRIIAPKSFGSTHLATAIAEFAVAHPDIHVTLVLDDAFTRSVDFVNAGFDIAIRLQRIPETSAIAARKIAALRWIVCAAPAFLTREQEPLRIEDLARAKCLVHQRLSPDRVWRFGGAGRKSSVRVSGVFTSNSFLALRRAALAGLGIAMLPAYFVSQDLKAGRLRRLLKDLPAIERPVYVLMPAGRQAPPKIRLFVNFLAAWFRRKPWESGLDDDPPGAEGRA